MMMLDVVSLMLAAVAVPADSAMWRMAAPAYVNPAVKQWMLPDSHSHIGPGYQRSDFNRPVDIQQGTGEECWKIAADAYLKYKRSALWGDASYSNGKQYDVRWNETADRDIIYPYLSADSAGGDMKFERYRFAGGYADRNADWAWGVSLSYDAGLYYRNVDPRPRNVTGLLEAGAGVLRRVHGDYFAGISAHYRKYKQSSDIDFKSQLGVEKIYHLTGLGSHYYRFAGTGAESYYNGNGLGATVNLYPSSGRGLALTANFNRFTFNKVLTSLNRLPLAHVWQNALELQAVYLHPGEVHGWSAAVSFNATRRHGVENVFGDAVSNVYPVIAALDMYADNSWKPGVKLLWQYHPGYGGLLMWVEAGGDYTHRVEAYASPRRRMEINHVNTFMQAKVSLPLGRRWRISAGADMSFSNPVGCEFAFKNDELQEPQAIMALEQYRYYFLNRSSRSFGARAGVRRQLNARLGLGLDLEWRHTSYARHVRRNSLYTSISVYF